MSGWGQGNDYSQQRYDQQSTANQFAAPQQQAAQYGYSASNPGQQQQPNYGGVGTNQALQPSAGAGSQQGYNYVAPAQQSFGQQLQGQQQTGYNQTQAAGYSAYGSQQGIAAKPSAAVQAVQGLAPDQQAKLTQIMAQVQGSAAQGPMASGGLSSTPANAQGYQYGAQTAATQPMQQAGQSVPSYGQYEPQGPAGQQQQQGYGQASALGYGAQPPVSQAGYGNLQAASGSYGNQQTAVPAQGYGSQQQGSGYNARPQGAGYDTQQPGFDNQQQGFNTPQQTGPSPAGYGAPAQPGVTPAFGIQQQPSYSQPLQQAPGFSSGVASQPATQEAGYAQQNSTPAYNHSAPRPAPAYQQPSASGYGQSTRPAAYNPPSQFGRGQAQQPAQGSSFRPSLQHSGVSQSASTWRNQSTAQQSSYAQKPAYGRGSASSVRPAAGNATSFPRPAMRPTGTSRQGDARTAGSGAAGKGGFSAPAAGGFGKPFTSPSRASMMSGGPGVPPPPGRASTSASKPQEARDPANRAFRDRLRDRDGQGRDRDRGRDREKDRERERTVRSQRGKEPEAAKRERTPPPARRAASPRKPPEYAVKVASRPSNTLHRDYMDLVQRYTRLYVPADFAKCVSLWTLRTSNTGSLGCTLIPLDHAANFEHDVDYAPSANVNVPHMPATKGKVKYNARVALLCGLDDAAKRDLLKGPTHGGSHLHNLLKFLTVRSEKGSTRAGITLLGGPHDPAADGDDPERNEQVLVNTCVRYARLQLDLDISKCSTWIRFLDVHYQRPPSGSEDMETEEVTAVFLADASECFPTAQEWPKIWEEQQAWRKGKAEYEAKLAAEQDEKDGEKHGAKKTKEGEAKAASAGKAHAAANDPAAQDCGPTKKAKAEHASTDKAPAATGEDIKADKGDEAAVKEEGAAATEGVGEVARAPDVPVLLAKGRLCENRERWRSACISLDGLLDYDEEDNDEGTLEMNLFAENFSELLSRDYGRTILDALYQERSAALKRREDRKRKREAEERKAEDAKKSKAAEGSGDKSASAKPDSLKEDSKPAATTAEPEAPAEKDVDLEGADAGPPAHTLEAVEPSEAAAQTGEAAVKVDDVMEEATVENGAAARTVAGQGQDRKVSADPREADMEEAKAGLDADADGKMEADRAEPQAVGDVKMEDAQAEEVKEEKESAPVKETGTALFKEETGPVPAKEELPAGGPADNESKEEKKPADGSGKDDDKKEEPRKTKKKYAVHEPLMLAFRYFDKTGSGYIKVDDLRRIIHNLGFGLSHRTVKELCVNVADSTSRRPDRIIYRDLYEKEVKEVE